MSKNVVRLYCDANLRDHLKAGDEYVLTIEQRHYLIDVMRCKVADKVHVLDGRTGQYESEIILVSRKEVRLRIFKLLQPLSCPADLWLLFAPIKKSRTELIIEKCVELGVKKIMPVITDFTNLPKFSKHRFKSIMISSAQQCGSTWVPELEASESLESLLQSWDSQRLLIFCDERLGGMPITKALQPLKSSPMAILVGPEGGFSEREVHLLAEKKFVRRVSLGPQVLRAETAVIASVGIWQSICGVWVGN